MMNILPRNPADREAKSPCDKNIRYPVCVPGHDSPNGTTFLTIVVYDKQKTALVDDSVTWSTLVDCIRAESLSGPKTIYSCDQVTWIIHSVGFLIIYIIQQPSSLSFRKYVNHREDAEEPDIIVAQPLCARCRTNDPQRRYMCESSWRTLTINKREPCVYSGVYKEERIMVRTGSHCVQEPEAPAGSIQWWNPVQ
jgi:hypothetical protein